MLPGWKLHPEPDIGNPVIVNRYRMNAGFIEKLLSLA
jgi:hypothetical protein